MPEPHDPYAALRHRDYRRLLGGSIIASIGAQMQAVAVGWELYEHTRQAEMLGYVGLVLFLPVLFLSLPAGQFIDRHSRKGVLLGAMGLSTLTALGLAALSYEEGPVWMIYLCLLGAGVGRAFSAPARWALVAEVVPPALISNAVTWNSSGWQVASVVGPTLGGLVIWLQQHYLGAHKQAWAVYLLTAAAASTCAVLISTLHPRPQDRPPLDRSLHSLLEGVRFVWRSKLILATITLDLFAVLLGGGMALLPVFAKEILHVGPRDLGWLYSAPSLGALVMAVTLAHRPPFQHAGKALLWAVAGFGLAWIIFGLSRNYYLSFAMLALTGALDNISIVVRGTLVQVLAPNAMRGRISAVNSIFIGSSNELGAFESGYTAQWFGPVASVVGGGIGSILVVAAVLFAWPQVRRLGSLHAAALGTAALEEPGPQELAAHGAEELPGQG
jgi:MFS family permease